MKQLVEFSASSGSASQLQTICRARLRKAGVPSRLGAFAQQGKSGFTSYDFHRVVGASVQIDLLGEHLFGLIEPTDLHQKAIKRGVSLENAWQIYAEDTMGPIIRHI